MKKDKPTFDKKIIFAFIVLVVLLFVFSFFESQMSKENKMTDSKVCFKENCFFVEIACTSIEIARGLMFRDELPADRGMLFVFKEEGIHSFWMKNTHVPLDIIWINENKEIVFISKNTPPCGEECPSVVPDKSATYVLEVNGGATDAIGLEIGDKLSFTL